MVRAGFWAASSFLAVSLTTLTGTAAPTLRAPWPCGVTYSVTQGHNTGSHTAEGSWAWDFGIPVGGELVAPAAGTVRLVKMDSTTGGCSNSYANDANYVVMDFGDGTEALFLHLEAGSSSLQPGDPVQPGDPIGRVGLTGWVCGAHLHFQIQQTCGSWWCQSVPADFESWGDPGLGVSMQSDNCGPAPSCGARLDGGTTTIDELDDSCFDRVTSYWWSVGEGDGGHHYYTFATDAGAPETWGRWRFSVDTPGPYRVEAFIPTTEASSQQARYEIFDGAATHSAGPIDQANNSGWVELGVHTFSAGEDRSVTLNDNTGEAYDPLMRKLAFDSLRLTWTGSASGGSGNGGSGVGGSTPAGGMSGGGVPATGGSSTWPGGGAPSSGGGWPDPDAGGSGGVDSNGFGAGPSSSSDSNSGGGCGCSFAPTSLTRTASGLVLLVLIGTRRRRGHRAPAPEV